MGMFDCVVGITVSCPKCGKDISDFQTKEGQCVMADLDYREVNRFYALCSCGQWIEYRRKPATDLTDFEMLTGRR